MPSLKAMDRNGHSRRACRFLTCLPIVASLCTFALPATAQQPAIAVAVDLPQEPLPQQPATTSSQVVPILGRLTGQVTDSDGDFVPGAHIALTGPGSSIPLQAVTNTQGIFSFPNLPAGMFKLSVLADGLATRLISLNLAAGEQKQLETIALPAAANMAVSVVVSQHDLAEEELKVEEKQRIGGFIPNFFVAYDWKAAPLTAGQKFELAWRTTLDPSGFLLNAAFAGVEQANNSFPGYGQGAAGYGKRFGAATADYTVGTMVGGYLLPVLFRQDPRYFYMGTGTVRHRTLYALASAVICRGDNGKWQPNYSSVLGDLAAGAISNIYYPASDRNGATLTIENGLLSTGADAIGNVIQEFLLRRLTPGTHKQQP